MRYGWRHGVSAGLGAACADAIYGAAAALGLGALVLACPTLMTAGKYIGACFLLYLGLKLLLERSIQLSSESREKPHLASLFASTLALTLASPMTMASFVAMFSACKLTQALALHNTAGLVLGLFFGSLTWWFVLSFTIDRLRGRFSQTALALVNKVSGLSIIGFAFWSIC
jgi:threonine/homoserine/homoserine lactone efflux protein